MLPYSHNLVRKLIPVTVREQPHNEFQFHSPVKSGTKGWVDGWFSYVTGDAPPFEVEDPRAAHAARVRLGGPYDGMWKIYPHEPLTEWFFIDLHMLEFDNEEDDPKAAWTYKQRNEE